MRGNGERKEWTVGGGGGGVGVWGGAGRQFAKSAAGVGSELVLACNHGGVVCIHVCCDHITQDLQLRCSMHVVFVQFPAQDLH